MLNIFLTAALIILSFPPFSFYPLIFVALIPWLFSLQRSLSQKRPWVRQALVLNFLVTLGAYYWLAYTLKAFADLPWGLAILGMSAFCAFGQLQFLGFAWAFRWSATLSSSRWTDLGRILFLSAVYVGLDSVAPKLFRDTLGQSLWRDPYLRQWAEWIGIFGLSFLVVVVNLAQFAWIQKQLARQASVLRTSWPVAFFLLIPFWILGSIRHGQIDRLIEESATHPEYHARFSLIQANIGDFLKLASEKGIRGAGDEVINRYLSLSTLALEKKPDFVVWPETAYPSLFGTPENMDESRHEDQIQNWVKQNQTPLLFGGYDVANRKDFNSVFFLYPHASGTRREIYHKHHLLLFGETIPFADDFLWIRQQFPQVGQFGRGPGPQVFAALAPDGRVFKLSPVICYEILVPAFTDGAAAQGAQALLNLTNDSWYGKTSEPSLHLALASFRAIENRIPLIRSTNTGITTVINANGEVLDPSPWYEPLVMTYDVVMSPPQVSKGWMFVRQNLGRALLIFSLGIVAITEASRRRRATLNIRGGLRAGRSD